MRCDIEHHGAQNGTGVASGQLSRNRARLQASTLRGNGAGYASKCIAAQVAALSSHLCVLRPICVAAKSVRKRGTVTRALALTRRCRQPRQLQHHACDLQGRVEPPVDQLPQVGDVVGRVGVAIDATVAVDVIARRLGNQLA